MSGKHTPGPWFVAKMTQDNLVQVCVRDDREQYSICDLWGDVFGENDTDLTSEQKANAQLIATAPHMFSVLERILGKYSASLDSELAEEAKAVIHRARGDE